MQLLLSRLRAGQRYSYNPPPSYFLNYCSFSSDQARLCTPSTGCGRCCSDLGTRSPVDLPAPLRSRMRQVPDLYHPSRALWQALRVSTKNVRDGVPRLLGTRVVMAHLVLFFTLSPLAPSIDSSLLLVSFLSPSAPTHSFNLNFSTRVDLVLHPCCTLLPPLSSFSRPCRLSLLPTPPHALLALLPPSTTTHSVV